MSGDRRHIETPGRDAPRPFTGEDKTAAVPPAATRRLVIRCDGCGAAVAVIVDHGPLAVASAAARTVAARHGWTHTGPAVVTDLCPDCSTPREDTPR